MPALRQPTPARVPPATDISYTCMHNIQIERQTCMHNREYRSMDLPIQKNKFILLHLPHKHVFLYCLHIQFNKRRKNYFLQAYM
jgi:hypothetical protein